MVCGRGAKPRWAQNSTLLNFASMKPASMGTVPRMTLFTLAATYVQFGQLISPRDCMTRIRGVLTKRFPTTLNTETSDCRRNTQ